MEQRRALCNKARLYDGKEVSFRCTKPKHAVKPPEKEETESKTTEKNKRRTTDDFRRANNISNVSRVPTKAEYKRRASLSFVCLSFKNRGVCIFFWCKSKRRYKFNNTNNKKKNKKEALYVFFASPAVQRETLKVTQNEKKEESKIERRIFLLSRIMGRDFASSSAFKREQKEIFLLSTARRDYKKLDSFRPLVISHI